MTRVSGIVSVSVRCSSSYLHFYVFLSFLAAGSFCLCLLSLTPSPIRYDTGFLDSTVPPFQCHCRGPSTSYNTMLTVQKVSHVKKEPSCYFGVLKLHDGYCYLGWCNTSRDESSIEKRSVSQVVVNHFKPGNSYAQANLLYPVIDASVRPPYL